LGAPTIVERRASVRRDLMHSRFQGVDGGVVEVALRYRGDAFRKRRSILSATGSSDWMRL
jgi:hypothetical protein